MVAQLFKSSEHSWAALVRIHAAPGFPPCGLGYLKGVSRGCQGTGPEGEPEQKTAVRGGGPEKVVFFCFVGLVCDV